MFMQRTRLFVLTRMLLMWWFTRIFLYMVRVWESQCICSCGLPKHMMKHNVHGAVIPAFQKSFGIQSSFPLAFRLVKCFFRSKLNFCGFCFRDILAIKIAFAGYTPVDYKHWSVEQLDATRIVSWVQGEDTIKLAMHSKNTLI